MGVCGERGGGREKVFFFFGGGGGGAVIGHLRVFFWGRFQNHTCHTSHCETKSHRILAFWTPFPIRFSNLTEFSYHLISYFLKK